MRIVDPTSGLAPGTSAEPVMTSTATGELCGLSNSKPGATVLLEQVGQRLFTDHHLGPMTLASKPSAAAGADPELLDHLGSQYRLAVVAIGD
jgi:thioredoxin reductase (NADPH)